MGQSHFKSNFIGFAGTEYIASLTALKNITTITGVTALNVVTASVNVLKATGATDSSYIKIGAGQYIYIGPSNLESSVRREAVRVCLWQYLAPAHSVPTPAVPWR